jgi:glycerophosphoryl diester phosphodiesterase
MRCHLWTVDRATHMRRALDLGVDGVITNHPDRLRRLVDDVHGRRDAPSEAVQ